MGLLDGLIRGLLKVICISPPQQEQDAPEPTYPGAGKPTYAQQPQQQQQPVHPAQYQYPPAQQQQWRPPQQPRPQQQQQQQEQHHGQPQPHKPRPHKHKPHPSHEYHPQPQGQGQGVSPHEPVAIQFYAIQEPPSPSPPQIVHPTSPPPTHGRVNQWASSPSPPQIVHPTSPPPTHGRVDQNQNQNLINSQNEHYVSLRASATREGDAMARAFEESHAAYARKDGAAAKELSNQGKAHQKEMERLNAEASGWIFRENNRGRMPGEVDLHGLFVKEAITYTDQSIAEARGRGSEEIRLIVGKGIHSPNHAAKLKPAIEELMQKHNLSASIDPQNSGVLIVRLEGGTGVGQVGDRGGVMLGADDITRRLDRKDEGCIIM